MSKKNKTTAVLIPISLFLSAVFIMLAYQNRRIAKSIENERILSVGDKIHLKQAVTVFNERIKIKGKISVLIFFNTTCSSCKNALRLWQNAKREHAFKHIPFLGISVDPELETISFIDRIGITFPVLSDSNHVLSLALRIRYLPASLLINSQGEVLYLQFFRQHTSSAIREMEAIIRKLAIDGHTNSKQRNEE